MQDYLRLIEMSYQDAVEFLLEKYGPVKENFFNEKSYNRLLNGEIKTISATKSSGVDRGLIRHHIDEDKYQNMTKENFIINQNIPYEAQKNERIVFCNLIEHAILHALISYETNRSFGYPGLITYMIPEITEWYIKGIIPTIKYQLTKYEKSYLSSEQVSIILDKITEIA